ncbi:phage holin family protein [Laribacter hongkongensis]|uniref:phage holin family protein n=2 Tax=Laribacter hongkongensis TaxID=168471 RepID=UPI001EFDDBCD|nr:phage holin family protein [Laribacter hongkongensis]MCG8995069.1 phage holin family protein [Laribacter hongkongensis]MCG8998450.1 phage holin family protein [Laribacter hongkongensis]MCG9011180.1 phage holin family protein [Laribacter hongkongensis]MCG9023579.1 phage holin family protein [Laribacter hongkongensis]MCG9047190.1 phage holin family protein [Laribacter hongkongensis]
MLEPITPSTASASLLAVALLTLFPGIDASVVLGAFAGSTVFVLSSRDPGRLSRVGFFAASFLIGLFAAGPVAALMNTLLPATVNDHVGALFASALAVRLLQWLIDMAADPLGLLARIRGGK